MSWLRNAIYLCFLFLAIPWLVWRAARQGKNRRGWLQKLFGWVPRRGSDSNCIWMHAVSVGEVNLLAPILKELQIASQYLDDPVLGANGKPIGKATSLRMNMLDLVWALMNAKEFLFNH